MRSRQRGRGSADLDEETPARKAWPLTDTEMLTFDPATYWDERYKNAYDLIAASYAGIEPEVAAALYERMRASVTSMLGRHHLLGELGTRRILDVGSGTGFWIDYWKRRGVLSVTSVEISSRAAAALRQRHPDVPVIQADIRGVDPTSVGGPFRLVSAMNVLVCVVDEGGFERTIRNLSSLLDPHGFMLLMDPVIRHQRRGAPVSDVQTSVARPLERWLEVFEQSNLRLIDIRPVTALLGNPVDTAHALTFRVLARYWSLLNTACHRLDRASRGLAKAAQMLDHVLVGAGFGPSLKLMLVRPADST